MPPRLEAAATLNRGGRTAQQDALLLLDPAAPSDPPSTSASSEKLLCAVADGMGGHAGGAEASAAAISALRRNADGISANFEAAAEAILQDMRQSISDLSRHDADLAEMGTTVVATWITTERLVWMSVGDSLLYLLRDGRLRRLNEDHSERSSDGGDTMLRSAVTAVAPAEIDVTSAGIGLQEGDLVLLASDGLLTLSPETTEACLRQLGHARVETAVHALMNRVIDAGRTDQDNLALILVRVTGEQKQIRHSGRFAKIFLAVLGVAGAVLFFTAILLIAMGSSL